MDRVARHGSLVRASGALKSHNAEKLKGGRFFNIHSVAKHEKIEENKNFYFRETISQCRKKLKGGGGLWDPFCRKTSKKCRGDPLGKIFFRKKVSQCRKNERGDPLVSPGMVWYAGKHEKPFGFSSLGQIVQFGAIIFLELSTILVSSCG